MTILRIMNGLKSWFSKSWELTNSLVQFVCSIVRPLRGRTCSMWSMSSKGDHGACSYLWNMQFKPYCMHRGFIISKFVILTIGITKQVMLLFMDDIYYSLQSAIYKHIKLFDIKINSFSRRMVLEFNPVVCVLPGLWCSVDAPGPGFLYIKTLISHLSPFFMGRGPLHY